MGNNTSAASPTAVKSDLSAAASQVSSLFYAAIADEKLKVRLGSLGEQICKSPTSSPTPEAASAGLLLFTPEITTQLLGSPLVAPLLASIKVHDPSVTTALNSCVGPDKPYATAEAFWRAYLIRLSHIVAEAKASAGALEDTDDGVEQMLLFTSKETFCYKLPPRRAAAGYTASEWNLESPLLTGYTRVVALGDKEVTVAIWQKQEVTTTPIRTETSVLTAPAAAGHKLVAVCRIPIVAGCSDKDRITPQPLHFYLEPVLDSSRYFAMRVSGDAADAHAAPVVGVIGMGYADRQSAFDLKASITEHLAFIARQRAPQATEEAPVSLETPLSSAFTLQPTEKIVIQLKNTPVKAPTAAAAVDHGAERVVLLAPPRPPPSQTDADADWDEFAAAETTTATTTTS